MHPNKRLFFAGASLALIATLALGGCGYTPAPPTAEQKDAAVTAQMNAEATAEIGMPNIAHHTEKRLAVSLAELRDQPNLITYSYVSGIDGRKICVGKSIGYPLPYATQITNPSHLVRGDLGQYSGDLVVPQSEPNGLYTPASADATWVVLVGPDGKPSPFYEEQKVSVSLFPLTGPLVAVTGSCK